VIDRVLVGWLILLLYLSPFTHNPPISPYLFITLSLSSPKRYQFHHPYYHSIIIIIFYVTQQKEKKRKEKKRKEKKNSLFGFYDLLISIIPLAQLSTSVAFLLLELPHLRLVTSQSVRDNHTIGGKDLFGC